MTTLDAKVTDEVKFRQLKLESVGKEVYFSDLTEEQVMKLFGEGPLYRFESFNACLQYGSFWKKLKLFGFIQAAEWPVLEWDILLDGALNPYGFLKLFNREYNDPLVVPDLFTVLNDSFHCSIPFSNYIQFEAKLYIFTDWVDDIDTDDDYYNELKEDRVTAAMKEDMEKSSDDDIVTSDMKDMEKTSDDDKFTSDMDDDDVENDNNNNGFRSILAYFDIYTDGRYILKEKEDAEKIDEYDSEFYQKLAESDVNYYPTKLEEKDDVVNDNQLFEICNEYLVFSFSDYLSKRPNGGPGSFISKAKNGLLELFYVILKYAVDATLEVEIVVTTCKEIKIDGQVMAYYGKYFDYSSHLQQKDLYSALLFQAKPDDLVKPGKVDLMQSVMGVPAQFSLIFDADLRDPISKESILMGVYEFHVPCQGGSSVASIEGGGFSLKLEVDWKLPPNMINYSLYEEIAKTREALYKNT